MKDYVSTGLIKLDYYFGVIFLFLVTDYYNIPRAGLYNLIKHCPRPHNIMKKTVLHTVYSLITVHPNHINHVCIQSRSHSKGGAI